MKPKSKEISSPFKGKVSANAHEEKTKGSQYGYLNLPKGMSIFVSPTSGKILIDILPYRITDKNHPDKSEKNDLAREGDLWYKRPYKVHRNIGSSQDSYVCPTSIGKPCPICEYRAARKMDNADKEELRALNAAKRNLYFVVPLGIKDFEEKPHIWDVSQFLFQDKLIEELEENPEADIFPDPVNGKSLRIRFTEGSIGKNKFGEVSRIDFEDREQGYDKDVADDLPSLDELLIILPYAQLKAKFLEIEAEEGSEEAKDDTETEEGSDRTSRSDRGRKYGSLRDEKKFKETEEEEAEDEETEEEVEEEKSAKDKPRQFSRKKKEEPEEEAESEEEDDDTIECVACKGTGKNSRGGVCHPCRGKGRLPKPEGKCPHDHTFGKDCDKYPDDCDDCKVWADCIEAKEVKK